ncbi:MAG: T9SS type A sorting domain-containing protein, partial [bacterium]
FSTNRDRELTIPGGAPAGTYSLNGYLGIYNETNPTIYTEDNFDFVKEGVGESGVTGWFIDSGEDFTILNTTTTSKPLPSSLTLLTSHPNPFNPLTTINFSLPKEGLVKLTVYDLLGRQVALLVNGHRDAGIHDVSFDAQNLASGVYIYRLTAGDYTASAKMVLMK